MKKGQISANKLEGKNISFIAREQSRSQIVVRNYLNDPESYGTLKRLDRPPKITNAIRRRLFREASRGQSTQDVTYGQNIQMHKTFMIFIEFSYV